MEILGTLSEGAWNSLGGIYLYQEADFKEHLGTYEDSISSVQPTLCPSHASAKNYSETEKRAFCSFDAIYHYSHWSSNVNIDDDISISFFPNSSYDDFENLAMESQPISTEICDSDVGNSLYLIDVNNSTQVVITGGDESKVDLKDTQFLSGSDDSGKITAAISKKRTSSAITRKRKQNTEDGNVRNNRRKNQKPDIPGKNDESHALTHVQGGTGLLEGNVTSRQEPSENLSNISYSEAVPLNLMGKTRATRGSATDPQSLYARKRRERINGRLRILQKLVPTELRC